MADGWVSVNDVRLHYVEWLPPEPRRQPDLFLFHGTSSNALYWTRLVHQIPSRRAFALDQRGHGHSDRPTNNYSVETMAADAANAIESLGVHRPLAIGHSLGTAVALKLASAEPKLVSGLVLVDGPVASLTRCVSWDDARREMYTPAPDYANLEDAEGDQAWFLREAWADDLRPFVRANFVHREGCWRPALPDRARLQLLRSLYDFSPEACLSSLNVPTLIAIGSDLSDGVAPDVLACWRQQAQSSAELCPHQAQVRSYESRHDIPLIRPHQLALDVEEVAAWAAAASS